MSSIELEKTEEIAKDLGEPKPKRKYVKKPKPEVELTPPLVAEEKSNEPPQPKEKKPRSEAQQKAFEKCLESKREKTALRKEEKAQQLSLLSEEKLMRAEDKIFKTGVKLQKKKLIELAIEDGDGIDEIPDAVIKAVLKKRASKKAPAPSSVPNPSHTPPCSPSRKYSFIDN